MSQFGAGYALPVEPVVRPLEKNREGTKKKAATQQGRSDGREKEKKSNKDKVTK